MFNGIPNNILDYQAAAGVRLHVFNGLLEVTILFFFHSCFVAEM